jgi:IS30 family transposase
MKKIDPAEVVRMYESELLSIREIAKRLGRSYGAVHRIVSTQATPRSSGHRAKKSTESVPCGSKRAYQRHLDRGEEPDEQCKKANRDYTVEFDRRTGSSRARNRAYRRLARSYPAVFEALLDEERGNAPASDGEAASDRAARYSRARERAHRRLTKIYPDIFQQMLIEEKAVAKHEPPASATRPPDS